VYQGLHSRSDHASEIVPVVIPRSKHPISRRMIDEEALKVLYRLHRHGYLAFLVGGSVRDFLIGKIPKDFDVATSAHPHEVSALFRNSRVIGRRFRLVHVFFHGGKTIEVSTFRSRSEFEEVESEDGSIVRKDSFGTPEEDALRRDLTINGLFYNIANFSIIDYVGGMVDLERKVIRTIGNPGERFKQDPVRMIRVLRHAARTGFTIEDETFRALIEHRDEIRKCSPSRVRDEFFRDLKEGMAEPSLRLMLQTDLLLSIFPDFERVFGERNPFKRKDREYLLALFHLIDDLNRQGKPVSEAVLIALFLTPFLQAISHEHPFLGERERYLYSVETAHLALHQALVPFSIPKGIRETAFQILTAQPRLKRFVHSGMIPKKWKAKRHLLDAIVFYGITAQARGEEVPSLIRGAAPADLLPWWPKEDEVQGSEKKRFPRGVRMKRRRRSRKKAIPPQGNS
jgi:poly(A) polymerase